MPLPAFRNSRSRVRRRRSHHALKAMVLGVCQSCQAPVKPHHACPACGQYKAKKTEKSAPVEKAK